MNLLFTFLVILISFQQAPLSSMTFPSYNSVQFSASTLKNKKNVVFIFLMPDCPFCQKYSRTLNNLDNIYDKEGVQFVGVMTGDLYTEKEVKEFISKYKIRFPVIHDRNKKLISYYKLSVSPSVVLSDINGKALYTGAIDNWAISAGKTRQVITEHYLHEAIKTTLEGKEIVTKKTDAVGCIIE